MCSNWVRDILDNIRHKIGIGNQNPTPVHAGQEVWLLDNTAFRDPNNPERWTAEFVAAYFTQNSGKNVAKVVADIAEKLGLAGENADPAAEQRIAERVQPFLNMILAAKTVDIRFSKAGTLTLGPSNTGGVSVDELPLPGSGYMDDQVVWSEAVLTVGSHSHMQTAFADPEGWGVISGRPWISTPCLHRAHTARYRRHHQGLRSARPQGTPPPHLRRAPPGRPRDARILHPHPEYSRQARVVLLVSLSIQPVPYPALLHVPVLPPWPDHPAHDVLDGVPELPRVPHCRYPGIQGRAHEDGDEVAAEAEMDPGRRLDAERSRGLRYYVCRYPFRALTMLTRGPLQVQNTSRKGQGHLHPAGAGRQRGC